MITSLVLCVIGFIFLSYAADKLVEGASNLAMNFGVSKTVIGLTVVAAGTSLPEMVVSVNASLKGNPSLSLGNLVGSNIMNAGLILGIAALIHPITCSREIVRREVPIMIGTSLLLWYMAHTDAHITPTEGLLLFLMLFCYTGLSYYWSRNESNIAEEIASTLDDVVFVESDSAGEKEELPSASTNFLYVILGMIGLVIGSETLVRGAVTIATMLGVSDEVIGLTLIAIGTSLPELATSVVAARKGHSEITLGNVVGSNIFNVLGIVGCASAVSYFNVLPEARVLAVSPEMLGLHIPLMVVVSLGVLPIMSTGLRIIRAEGALLVGVYLAYNVMLFHTMAPALLPVEEKNRPASGSGQLIKPETPKAPEPVKKEIPKEAENKTATSSETLREESNKNSQTDDGSVSQPLDLLQIQKNVPDTPLPDN